MHSCPECHPTRYEAGLEENHETPSTGWLPLGLSVALVLSGLAINGVFADWLGLASLF